MLNDYEDNEIFKVIEHQIQGNIIYHYLHCSVL